MDYDGSPFSAQQECHDLLLLVLLVIFLLLTPTIIIISKTFNLTLRVYKLNYTK